MVDWALIDWMEGAVRFGDIDEIEGDGHFYALLGAYHKTWTEPHVLYVGLAFDQHVVDRMKQDHAAYEKIDPYLEAHPKREVIVTYGSLVEGAYSLERVTKKFAKAIEALLIYANQPLFNSKHIENCSDRPLVVANAGDFTPLEQLSSCCDRHLEEWEAEDGRSTLEDWL